MVTNLFGELGLDSTIKALKNVISRFTFDGSGQLRTTVTTVGAVSTSNGSIGDSGKTSTIMQNSSMMFNSSVRRNFA